MSKIKLVVFDMDGTLINDRTIFVFAEKKGFLDDLKKLIYNNEIEFYKKSKEIAKSLKGMKSNELIKIFREIRLHENVEKVVKELKKRNIKTAIITDSYQFVADDLKKRLGIDYAFANNLIIHDDIVTGELEINNKELIEDEVNKNNIYSVCKSCILEKLCKINNIKINETMAIGDGKVDICMLKKAGIGIAFNAPEEVKKHADICTNNMLEILKYI